MVKKFKGNDTKNARIKIEYSGIKPKVTFSYPSKKYGSSGSMFPFIVIGWFIIWLIFSYGCLYNESDSFNSDDIEYDLKNYTQCTAYVNKTRETINETCTRYSKPIVEQIINDFNGEDTDSREMLILFLLGIIPPFLIYFPFKKFWANVYPKFNAIKARKKLARFNSKDVNYNSQEDYYFCEIPVFNNIVLNYNATKDFSKYLDFFEIREHNFKYHSPRQQRKKKITKATKSFRRRKMLNDWMWYAKFYFTKKPETGSLEVIFK